MLDAKDLEAIGNLFEEKMDAKLDKRISEFEEKIDKKLDKRIGELEETLTRRFDEKLDKSIMKSESMLLDEMDRMKCHLDAKIDKISNDVAEIKQYYRMDRLENQTITIMMRSIDELRKDVDELKEQQRAVGA